MNKKDFSSIAIKVGAILVTVSITGFTYLNVMQQSPDVRWMFRMILALFAGAVCIIVGLVLKSLTQREKQDPNKPAWAE